MKDLRIKKSLLIVFVIGSLLIGGVFTTTAQTRWSKITGKKTAAPRTVYDFYQKLPAKYFPFLKRLTDRRDFVESDDAKNDYLCFGANVPFPPEHAEMALLKRMNGSFYIVISYTDDDENDGQGVLRFLKYANGRFTLAKGGSPIGLKAARELFRRKTGRDAGVYDNLFYRLTPSNKTMTVLIGDVKLYESEWDGNFYDFTYPIE